MGVERVDEVEVASGVGHRVARRVAHFVLAVVLGDLFHSVGDARLHVVLAGFLVEHQLYALHVGFQIVSCVLHIGAHTEVLTGFCLCEPVLSLNVVGFLLLGIEGRRDEREVGVLGQVSGDVERAKEGAEQVALPTVEIDAEGLHVLHRAKLGLAVFGLEVVVVVRNVADEVDGPALVGLPGQVGLVVEEVRIVFALGLQRAQQVAVGLVAQSVAPCQAFLPWPGPCRRFRRAGLPRCCLPVLRGAVVFDVKGRRHLVAVFCFETARREAHTLHHVGVDDGESFLLSAAHEEWTDTPLHC